MNHVVDASVALKWVLQEDLSEAARALVSAQTLIAPNLLMIECGNVLWASVRRKQIDKQRAIEGLAKIMATPLRLHAEANLLPLALTIAFDVDRSAYDSLYLALAVQESAVLVTADEKFFRAVDAHPVYRGFIRKLGAT